MNISECNKAAGVNWPLFYEPKGTMLGTKTLGAIDKALQDNKEDPFRNHLGASVIGNKCERAVWYTFRWFDYERFSSQMLRLLNRGHIEEPRMASYLEMIGATVWRCDANGNQFRVSALDGHFGGSLDGVGKGGVPEILAIPYLCEFKTYSENSFNKLEKNGVCLTKPEHYSQMQVYMRLADLQAAVYIATNKNTDDLHIEIVQRNDNDGASLLKKAERIIASTVAPKKLRESPGWYECKYCTFKDVCHNKKVPAINCRTCAHSYVAVNGGWGCLKSRPEIDTSPKKGCSLYCRLV